MPEEQPTKSVPWGQVAMITTCSGLVMIALGIFFGFRHSQDNPQHGWLIGNFIALVGLLDLGIAWYCRKRARQSGA